jgi:hypothetical protein
MKASRREEGRTYAKGSTMQSVQSRRNESSVGRVTGRSEVEDVASLVAVGTQWVGKWVAGRRTKELESTRHR